MPFNVDAVTLTLMLLLAAVVIGIVAYAIKTRMAARGELRKITAVRAVIIEYFRRSGVEVTVGCTRLEQNGRFIAVVESEPMKRFRLSHIIEMTLREHVRKACNLELDKIYWRFPVRQAGDNAATPGGAKPDPNSDEYINEGLEHYRHIPKPQVEELDWEQFEQAAIANLPKKDD